MDLFDLKVALLPFRVIVPESVPVGLSDAERGRQLFVAKGCSTCHAKLQDDQNVELRSQISGRRSWAARSPWTT